MFRTVALALAVLMLVGAVIGIAKKCHQAMAIRWSAPSRWLGFRSGCNPSPTGA
jgi:hypothetical protein